MTLTNAGNVGIGTPSPRKMLEVSGAAGQNSIQSQDGGSDFLRIYADSAAGSAINVNTGGVIRFAHSDEGFTNFAERMRIDSSGNLGIGTSSPSSKLDVRGTTGATIRVGSSTHGGSGDEFGNIEFYWGDPDAAEVKAKVYTKNVGNVGPGGGGAADLLFATRPAGGSLTERMRITSDGVYSYNGLITRYIKGSSASNVEFSYDFPFGPTLPFKVSCAASHWTGENFRAIRESYLTTDGYSNITILDIVNVGNVEFFGGWIFTQPDASTLRITKTAGSGVYSMYFWIKVESP
jgi:hypothetical protein